VALIEVELERLQDESDSKKRNSAEFSKLQVSRLRLYQIGSMF
jgi:hypothetical protein